MSKFDFMAFGYDAGGSDMFVAHAGKYTVAETVELCMQECEHKFRDWDLPRKTIKALRLPTVADVQEARCAFRFGVSPEWPDGCYTLVGEGEQGAFPVHVIDFASLKGESHE